MLKKRFDKNDKVKIFTYKDFNNLNANEFNFLYKNKKIKGYIYNKDSNLDYVILFFHGYGGGHENYMHEIYKLTKLGYTVISYDNLGCFNSEGKMKWFLDSLKVSNEFKKHFYNDEIFNNLSKKKLILMGHSWGAFTSVCSLNIFDKADKVVELSAINSFNFIKFQGHNFYVFGPFIYLYNLLNYGKYATYSVYKTLKKTNKPILLIHGEKDDMVKIKDSYDKYKKINKNNLNFILEKDKFHSPQLTLSSSIKLNDFMKAKIKLEDIKWEELCEVDKNIFNKIDEFIKGENDVKVK